MQVGSYDKRWDPSPEPPATGVKGPRISMNDRAGVIEQTEIQSTTSSTGPLTWLRTIAGWGSWRSLLFVTAMYCGS